MEQGSAPRFPAYLAACPPRFGPFVPPDWPNYGPRLTLVHRILTGRAPMPQQQFLYDVLGLVDPVTGRRVFRDVLLSLSRQQGKTTGMQVVKTHRALDDGKREPQVILFAAQDGDEAKAKQVQHAKTILASPFGQLVKPGQPVTSNGKEKFEWQNGTVEFPLSLKESSGHGNTVHLGLITEAFSQRDYRYETTMTPAMRAVPDAQLFVESAAGTATSVYWNERTTALRERFDTDTAQSGRIALIDWSPGPDDDPEDEATWAKVTPALGNTITLDQLRFEREAADTPSLLRAWMRGALNVTDYGAAAGSILAEEDVEACIDAGSRIDGTPAVALDVANDRSWSAIGMAGENQDGLNHVGLVRYDRGTHWVIEQLVNVMHVDTVAVGTGTQAAAMAGDLERAGLTVIVLPTADVTAACAGLYDEIVEHLLRMVPGQTALLAALAGAVWTAGDARKFSRANSTIDISPLYAVTLARHLHLIESREAPYDPLAHIL